MWPFAKCCQIRSIQTFCELYQHWNEHLNLHSLYLFVFFVCCLLWAFRCMSLFLSFFPPDLSDLSAFQSSFLLSSSVFFLLSLLLLSKPRRVILMCTLLFFSVTTSLSSSFLLSPSFLPFICLTSDRKKRQAQHLWLAREDNALSPGSHPEWMLQIWYNVNA